VKRKVADGVGNRLRGTLKKKTNLQCKLLEKISPVLKGKCILKGEKEKTLNWEPLKSLVLKGSKTYLEEGVFGRSTERGRRREFM